MILKKQFLLLLLTIMFVSSISKTSNAVYVTPLTEQSITTSPETLDQNIQTTSEFIDISSILKSRTLEYMPESETEAEIEVTKPSLTPSIQVVGDEEQFWVFDYVGSDYDLINATLEAIGVYCYIYVANNYPMSAYDITAFMTEFDNTIYPEETAFFGDTDGTLGDIDGDPKITLFFYYIPFAAGYFDSLHEHPVNYFNGYEFKACSNEREMVFMRYDQGFGTLAHEFNHLIHYNTDQTEDRFLDEAFAEMGAWTTGYMPSNNRSGFVSYFENFSNDSLLWWDYYNDDHDSRIDYGGAYLFIFYCVEQFGIEILEPLMSSQEDGAVSIENTLSSLGHSIDFETLFTNWYLAMRLDDPSLGDGEWGYRWLDVTLYDKIEINTAPISVDIEEFEWSGTFYYFNPGAINESTVTITAPIDANYQLVFLPYDGGISAPYDSVWVSAGNSYQVTADQWNSTERFEMLVLTIPNDLTGGFGIGDLHTGSFVFDGASYSVTTGDFSYLSSEYNFNLENVSISFDGTSVEQSSIGEVTIHFFDDSDTDQTSVLTVLDLLYNSETQTWYYSETLDLASLLHGMTYYRIVVIIDGEEYWSAKSSNFAVSHELMIKSLSVSNTSADLNTYSFKSSFNFTNPLWDEYEDDLIVIVEFYEDGAETPFDTNFAYYSITEELWITSISLTSDIGSIYAVIDASITIADDLFRLEITTSLFDLEYYPPETDPSSDPSDTTSNNASLLSLEFFILSIFSLLVIRRFTSKNKL